MFFNYIPSADLKKVPKILKNKFLGEGPSAKKSINLNHKKNCKIKKFQLQFYVSLAAEMKTLEGGPGFAGYIYILPQLRHKKKNKIVG